MSKKAKRARKQPPQLKKEIGDFLSSEEGKISKKSIAKIGISLAALGLLLQSESAHAQHTSNFFEIPGGGHHSSTHANHGNHGSGGPCGW
ncbi:MAG: hypothetical protein ACM3L6_02895 [Deltaproteobacteria bacterium]